MPARAVSHVDGTSLWPYLSPKVVIVPSCSTLCGWAATHGCAGARLRVIAGGVRQDVRPHSASTEEATGFLADLSHLTVYRTWIGCT